ncbi:MAG: hypothetical protein ACHRHE_14660 [Tepidisphaerales bacterium]
MPIRVRCPRCWETAEVPDEARGKMGRCNSCGAIVKVPERIAKVCFICGKDVTHLKHTKDLDNNYLCMDCWENRNPDQRASFNIPTIECSICHATFVEGEGFERDGKPVCRDCNRVLGREKEGDRERLAASEGSLFSGAGLDLKPEAAGGSAAAVAVAEPAVALSSQNLDDLVKIREPEKHLDEEESKSTVPAKWEPLSVIGDREFSRPGPSAAQLAAAVAQARRAGGRWPTALALIALAAAGYAIYLGLGARPSWDEENRTRLEILKAQGDVLIDAGRADKGILKYHELLKMVNGQFVRDPAVRKIIKDTQSATDRAEALVVDPWEDQNRTKLLVLRAQADVFVAVGKYREGIDRYSEMIRMASGHALSQEMNEEVRQAQLARQEAKLEQQRIESRPKPPPVTQADPRPPVDPKPPAAPAPAPTTKATDTHVGNQTPDTPVDPNHKIRPNIFDTPPDKPDLKLPKPTTRKSVFD